MERFECAIDEELGGVVAGRAVFKAVRGEYGSGKTFSARWLAERAKRRGMAAAEIQISENRDTLHKLETDVLDRVAEFDDFDPRQHYNLTLSATELTDAERNAVAFHPASADDVDLDL
jgi:hypothetical protein